MDVAVLFTPEFEKGMDALWTTRKDLVQSFQQDLARYFLQFQPRGRNHYKALIKVLRHTRVEPIISTLNYDLLIELVLADERIDHNHIASINKQIGQKVYKLHGSCNMVPHIPSSIEGFLLVTEPGDGGVDADSVKSLSISEMHAYLSPNQSVVPCIAAFHSSKTIRDAARAFVRLRSLWKEEMERTDVLFIIGARVAPQDTHIWDVVKSLKGQLQWIGPPAGKGATGAREWADSCDLEFNHYADGFKEFVQRYTSDYARR